MHGDHHELGGECYQMISERFAWYVVKRNLTIEEARDMYALDYESVAVWTLIRTIGE